MEIEVKRSSWHYKISNFGEIWESSTDNLCGYFQRLVLKSLVFIGATLALVFFA